MIEARIDISLAEVEVDGKEIGSSLVVKLGPMLEDD